MKRNGPAPCVLLVLAAAFGINAAARAEGPDPVKLSLEDTILKAVQENLDVQSQSLDWSIAKWTRRKEWAVFEPEFSGSARREANHRENTVEESRNQLSPFFEERNNRYDAGIEQLLPPGTRLRFGLSLNDFANNLTNSTVPRAFDSEYQSFAGITFRQPLLKNRGMASTMAAIRLAGLGMDASVEDFRRKLMQVVAQTEVAYWNLAFAERQLALRQGSVIIAEKLLEDNRERVLTGKMAELEVYQAEAGVASRRTRVEEARRDWIEAQDQLRTLLSTAWADSDVVVSAIDEPRLEAIDADFDEGMKVSTRMHPDYRKALKTVEQEKVRVSYTERQRWPQVDLVGSYGYNGLGNSVGTSWDDISGRSDESWLAGVEVRIPLGGGQADRSDLQIAKLRKERALLDLKSIEIAIGNALHSAVERVSIARKSAEDNRKVAEFSQKVLQVERERLNIGKSNSRRVLEVEDDVLNAQVAEWKSVADFRKAIMEWRLAQGSILADHGLDLVSDDDGYAELRQVDSLLNVVGRNGRETMPAPAVESDGSAPVPGTRNQALRPLGRGMEKPASKPLIDPDQPVPRGGPAIKERADPADARQPGPAVKPGADEMINRPVPR